MNGVERVLLLLAKDDTWGCDMTWGIAVVVVAPRAESLTVGGGCDAGFP